ncbi:MAG TPA: uroporphyrinogen-III C-methyltransferase [Acidimicrobiales bacterium]|nr:uroporphyrinogen-III C-methyltransferase [Acidimicrobiales bacterium]
MTLYPVMLNVAGRECLVVGGGRVARRKVEGLVAAGARVTVIAPEVDESIDALAVRVERRAYERGDAARFRLVITATDDTAVNAAVFDDAEAVGVWVNSADDIEHCSFTLPAIHRDGAVTVAVSTDGQSPAFAAWLRDRVRDTMPVGLGAVADALAAERRDVHARGATTEALDWRARIDDLVDDAQTGIVHLVGAGPGDPELLTLRAARLLAAADVVVHDALADTQVLDLVPDGVERIDVGKRPGRPVPQELINDLLVQLAQRHRTVVRLKGGDPFLFGRGGEEALALRDAGVPFEVVPGITSAIAAPAAAGVPVTQRGVSASVTVVTGHRRFGDEDETDWDALARVGGTIVVLMGVAERAAIARRLMDGGLSPDTPVTAVRYGTRPEQEVARTTLGALGDTPIEAPAAIVIGAVAGLDLSISPFSEQGTRRRS